MARPIARRPCLAALVLAAAAVLLGLTKPAIMRRQTVLPEPLAPSKVTKLPASTVRSMRRSELTRSSLANNLTDSACGQAS